MQNGFKNKIKQAAAFRVKQIVVTARISHPVREGWPMFWVSCLTIAGVHFCAKITSTFWTRTLGLPTMNCTNLPRSERYTPIVLHFDLNYALILKSTYSSNFNLAHSFIVEEVWHTLEKGWIPGWDLPDCRLMQPVSWSKEDHCRITERKCRIKGTSQWPEKSR